MSRATPLPPDERRRALIDATLPLLREHGFNVSTRHIAEAAGVAEGTIFRAFASKADLVDATIEDATSHERLNDRLVAEASGLPLHDTVTAVVGVLQAHAQDARLVFALLGHRPPRADGDATCRRPSHAELNARVATTLEALLAPHAAHLTLAPDAAAWLVLALAFGSAFTAPEGESAFTPAAVADVLLHGIEKEN